MKAITIRGVDPDMSEKLKKAAERDQKSVNQFVIEVLKEKLGINKPKRYTKAYHDLDHLFGQWSTEEYNDIQDRISAQRKIDEELWK